MQEVDISQVDLKVPDGIQIYGILGFIQIYPIHYLFVITGRKLVYEITFPEKIRIYEITDTALLVLHKEDTSPANKEYEQAILKIMKCGFYYSPDVDLTSRFHLSDNTDEEERERHSAIIQDIPTFRLEDLPSEDKFWWNKRLYEQMEYFDISDAWKVKVIRGHVGQDEIFIGNSTMMTLTLISRKATLMGGIIDTGIDDDGSTANFVETEQILEISKQFISFVMVRGSVP